MQCVYSYRANKILYNFLKSNHLNGKIILPVNICEDVVNTLQYACNTLHFVDIDTHSLCLDWRQVMPLIKDATAVIFVHTYGAENNLNEQIEKVRAINPQIAIIDDRCLCMPNYEYTDSTADLVLYSTGNKKQVDLGMGGIGLVEEKWCYEDKQVSENEFLSNDTWILDKRALLLKKNAVTLHKKKLNAIYRQSLPKRIQLPDSFNNWRFNILVSDKTKILDALFHANLFASSHYAVYTHTHTIASSRYPIASNLHKHVINLFNDFYYTEQQAIQTSQIINEQLKYNSSLIFSY